MEARTKYFDDSCQFFASFLGRVFRCNQANYLESKLIFLATKNGMISAMTKNDVTYPNLEISSPEDIDALNALHNEIDVHYLK